MKTANPLLESFRESSKACVKNFNRPLANFIGKENPGNTGLQSPRDLPESHSHYPPHSAVPLEKPRDSTFTDSRETHSLK